MKVYIKGIEILNDTEQVIVFAVKYKGKEIGATALINLMYYESDKEEAWVHNDNTVQKAIETLSNTGNYDVE
jgi:tagatose-1,6-bisphosphate aldolase